ncbi:MAG: glycoside hydrolase family 36 protein [Phycisphaeraceae bacterium JB051]
MTTDLTVLTADQPTVEFALGQTVAIYLIDPGSQMVSLMLVPAAKRDQMVAKREFLDTHEVKMLPGAWNKMPAQKPDSLVQLQLRHLPGPNGFAQGMTMRNNPSVAELRLESQTATQDGDKLTITTILANTDTPMPYACEHVLTWQEGDRFANVQTTFINRSEKQVTLDMLSSFSLTGMTPFAVDDAPGRLMLHRLRSIWSNEGRLDSQAFEELHIEPTWTGHAPISERFGTIGSMPVRQFFPWVAVEDKQINVLWGAQLAIASSWQIEAYRRGDEVNLSGGIADREFGHWFKHIAAGESFTAPLATVATVVGDVDELGHALTQSMVRAVDEQPQVEADLPIVFNEWCTSWGKPTHENMLANAEKLADTDTKIMVIDAGWTNRKNPEDAQENGDWNVNTKSFPQGLEGISKDLRSRGILPGVWFEWEVATIGSDAYEMNDAQLHRDGMILTVGTRHFWDLRNPKAQDYLANKLIKQLKDANMGYLKVDYNDTIGLGVDGAESLGEGLRQHVVAVQDFFRRMRRELPELIIENCSSGGHRLEPSMMQICAQGSFSDAHETVEIPIVAANLHRCILPRQSQIWAVLHQCDDAKRLNYSLAATFLGRMCLSGDIHELEDWQLQIVKQSNIAYRDARPIIKDGKSRIHRDMGLSYRHPTGYQTIIRESVDGNELLIVTHRFADKLNATGNITLPDGNWSVKADFGQDNLMTVNGNQLTINPAPEFCGQVLVLSKN